MILVIVSVQAEPLPGKIHKLLTWRWRNPPAMEDELDHTHSPTKKNVSHIIMSINEVDQSL